MAGAAGGASTGEWLQQLDKEGGGLPWLSVAGYTVNAVNSDPLTNTVTTPLCTHNGQKGLTGIL